MRKNWNLLDGGPLPMENMTYHAVDGLMVLTSASTAIWTVTSMFNLVIIHLALGTENGLRSKKIIAPQNALYHSGKSIEAIGLRMFALVDLANATFHGVVLASPGLISSIGTMVSWEDAGGSSKDATAPQQDMIMTCAPLDVGMGAFLLSIVGLGMAQAFIRERLFVSGINSGIRRDLTRMVTHNYKVFWGLACYSCFTVLVTLASLLEPGLTQFLLGREAPSVCIPSSTVYVSPYWSMIFTVLSVALIHWQVNRDNWTKHADILLRKPTTPKTQNEEIGNKIATKDMHLSGDKVYSENVISYHTVSPSDHDLYYFRSMTCPLLVLGFNPWIVPTVLLGHHSVITCIWFYAAQMVNTLVYGPLFGIWRIRKLLQAEPWEMSFPGRIIT